MRKTKRNKSLEDGEDVAGVLPVTAKRAQFAKTSKEQLYFNTLDASKKSRFQQRNAKVKSHKLDSLIACIKCGGRAVGFVDKCLRSMDEGLITSCICRDCGKSFLVS